MNQIKLLIGSFVLLTSVIATANSGRDKASMSRRTFLIWSGAATVVSIAPKGLPMPDQLSSQGLRKIGNWNVHMVNKPMKFLARPQGTTGFSSNVVSTVIPDEAHQRMTTYLRGPQRKWNPISFVTDDGSTKDGFARLVKPLDFERVMGISPEARKELAREELARDGGLDQSCEEFISEDSPLLLIEDDE